MGLNTHLFLAMLPWGITYSNTEYMLCSLTLSPVLSWLISILLTYFLSPLYLIMSHIFAPYCLLGGAAGSGDEDPIHKIVKMTQGNTLTGLMKSLVYQS